MSLLTIFGKMVVIMFGVAAGFAANRLGYFTKDTDQRLSKLIMNITMPAMILAAVMTGDELPPTETILSGLGVSAIFYGFGFVFMLVVPRFLGGTAGEKGVWGFSFLFPNLSFIGYPVITALLGKEALLFAVILVLPNTLLDSFQEKLGFYSCTVPSFEQYVLTELINNGDFERHINRVRRRKRSEMKTAR